MITVSIPRLFRRAAPAAAFVAAAISVWTTTRVSAVSTTLLISEFRTRGPNGGSDEFIELYNASAAAIDIGGYKLNGSSATGVVGTRATIPAGVILGAGCHYLLTNSSTAGGPYSGTVIGNQTYTTGIADDGGLALLTPGNTIVDQVGMTGAAVAYFETTKLQPTTSNINQSYERRPGQALGNSTDTDDNVADFVYRTTLTNPQNLASPCIGASTPPTGVGSSTPLAVNAGEPILLFVTVTPGSNPPSASLFVTANLSPFGSPSQQFFDDGSNGDVTAGDRVFSLSINAPAVAGTYLVPFTVSDNLARSSNGAFSFTVQGGGTLPLVISQVYGGGGNSGATWTNDFIELFNPGTQPIAVSGWSLQYASATGTTWSVTPLSGAIPAGHFYLVQEAAGSGGTSRLPAPDAIGTVAMSGTTGKVVLVTNTTALTGGCPSSPAIVDFVGYGSTATCFEGPGPAPTTSNSTAAKRKANGCTDTNNNAGDFFVGAPVPRNSGVAGDCTAPSGIPLAIHDIQGPGNASPYATMLVTTTGVVTAVKSNGFFAQTPDLDADTDDDTSEGIFVFTGGSLPGAASVGNYVGITGTVTEFFPDPNGASATEIAGGPGVTLIATGFALPTATVLTIGDTSPLASSDLLEKREGMRVSIPSMTVIAPTGGSISEANATSTSNGAFYGVIAGIPRPLREPGIPVGDPLPTTAATHVPRFDGNPERLRVDSDALVGAAKLEVTTGATVTGIVGPLDYTFRTYTVYPDPSPTPTVAGIVTATPVATADAREFTVASSNMERFFDTTNDPNVSDVALTTAAFDRRLGKMSMAIRNVMRMPDVIGVEEMENLTTLQALASRVSADAAANGQPDPLYQSILVEGNDIGGIDIGFLVKGTETLPGLRRIQVVDSLQFGEAATYINPNNGQPELLNDRPSLLLHAVVNLPGAVPFPVTIIVNHLRSLSGVDDTADGNRVRTKRRAQAEYLANYVQTLQAANPLERIVLVGDFNAFQFNDGYVDVMGTIKGTPISSDEVVLASADLLNPDLIDLTEDPALVPDDRRYSFIFDGSAQELDHALVTNNLRPFVSRFEYGRNNADFPESYRGDGTRPERISDHDPIVAYFKAPLVTTLNYTGDTVIEFGGDLHAAVDVSGPTSGSVTFSINTMPPRTAVVDIVGGAAAATFPALDKLGHFVVTATFAGDADHAPAAAHALATVRDTTAPVISELTPSVTSIWPPNKKLVPVTIGVAAVDAVDPNPACRVSGITSNEGTTEDRAITGPLSVTLRADRNGGGNGRIYAIAVTCTDASGNAAIGMTTVTVPHDRGR